MSYNSPWSRDEMVYSLAYYMNTDRPLSKNDHMKKYSKSYNRSDSAWITDFDAMAKKTVLLKAFKWVKKSPELEEQFYNRMKVYSMQK